MSEVIADHLPHDGGGASQRFDTDVDGPLGFQTTHQFMVVDDAANVGAVDGSGQFGWVVGIDDDHGLVFGHVRNDLGLVELPMVQHERRFGVWLSKQDRLCVFTFDLVEVPGPDDGAAGAVGVWRFMAENFALWPP